MSNYCYRHIVSASQDGKLILWDSYTTNKVNTFLNFMCFLSINSYKTFWVFCGFASNHTKLYMLNFCFTQITDFRYMYKILLEFKITCAKIK